MGSTNSSTHRPDSHLMTEQYQITRFAELRPAFEEYCRLIDAAAIAENDHTAAHLLRKADEIKQALEAFMSDCSEEESVMCPDLGYPDLGESMA